MAGGLAGEACAIRGAGCAKLMRDLHPAVDDWAFCVAKLLVGDLNRGGSVAIQFKP